MTTISDNELEAIAINAMGRASEGGFAAVRILGLADNVKDGIVHSSHQSGYTIGDIQWDFGAKEDKNVARSLLNRYNAWAKTQNNPAYPQENLDNNVTLLMQHGRFNPKKPRPEIEILDGKPDLRQSPLGHHLDAYLKTPDGIAFGRELTERQCKTDLIPAMHEAMTHKSISSKLESNNPEKVDEAKKILAMVSKITNQYGSFPKSLNPILDIADLTPETFLDKIKEHFHSHKDKNGKEVENAVVTSVKATMKGADLYNTLSHDKGHLGVMFRKQMQLDPTLLKSSMASNPETEVLDAMFRNPSQAQNFITHFNNYNEYQKDFQIDNHYGRIKDEAYTIGVTKEGQIYSVDKTGKGFYINHDYDKWNSLENLQDIGVAFHHHADHHHSDHQHSSRSNPPTHAEANQPLSPLAESLRGQIENLCRTEVGKLGFKWDGGMDNTVYALTAEALKNGFKQATHLALNDGIIDLGDLSADRNRLAALDSNIAAQTPVENSLKNISVFTQNQAQEESQKQTQEELQKQPQEQPQEKPQQQTQSKAPHMSA